MRPGRLRPTPGRDQNTPISWSCGTSLEERGVHRCLARGGRGRVLLDREDDLRRVEHLLAVVAENAVPVVVDGVAGQIEAVVDLGPSGRSLGRRSLRHTPPPPGPTTAA